MYACMHVCESVCMYACQSVAGHTYVCHTYAVHMHGCTWVTHIDKHTRSHKQQGLPASSRQPSCQQVLSAI